MTAMLIGSLLLAIVSAFPSRAADRSVTMTPPLLLASGFAAIPRISLPRDDAERRINAMAHRLDVAGRRAARECRGPYGVWERDVSVTMHGPGFLSYQVAYAYDCGSVHPDDSTDSLVYDLRTGRPVDWTKLLPPTLASVAFRRTGPMGARTALLDSAELRRRFLTAQLPQANPDAFKECGEVLNYAVQNGMRVWLDAGRGALALEPDLPHGDDRCAQPLFLTAAELRKLGAARFLTDALDAARANR